MSKGDSLLGGTETDSDTQGPHSTGLPARVKWLIFSLGFASLSVGYLIVYITAYMPETGFSSSSIGLLVGVFGLVPIVTGVPFGMFSDRKGRKGLLLLGSFGISPGMIIFALTSNLSYLLVSAVILGLSETASLTTWNAIIADQTSPGTRNSAFSLSFVVGIVSMGVGSAIPLAFPLLQRALSLDSAAIHQSFMVLFSLLALATPISLFFLLRGYVEVIRPKEKRQNPRGSLKVLLKFSSVNSLIGLGAGFIIPLIPTWLYLKFAVPDTFSGPLLAISNITIGLSAIGSTRLARKLGRIRAITLTTGTSIIFMLSLAFAFNPVQAAGLYVVRAALMNMASPLMDSYLMGIITVEERGLASAVNSIIWRLPNSVSTIIGGIILEAGRYDLPFYLATTFYAAAIALLYSVFRNVKPQN